MSVNVDMFCSVNEKDRKDLHISAKALNSLECTFYIIVDSPSETLNLKADVAHKACEKMAEYLGVRNYGIRAGAKVRHMSELKREFAGITSEKIEIVFVEKESLTIELLNHFERELFFNTVTDIAEGEDEDTLPLVKQIIEDRE